MESSTTKTKKTKNLPIYYSEQYRSSLGKLLELSSSQMRKLRNRLKKEITAYKDDTSTLQDRVTRWNDLVENVIQETNYPFPGAANLHIPVIAIYLKMYHSVLTRSIISREKIWYAESDNDAIRDYLVDIETSMNNKASSKWNIAEAISDICWTTPRDGLGIMQVPYVEQYENDIKDTVSITSEFDFIQEFPPEDMGMPEEEWLQLLQTVRTQASEENPMEIPIIYDREVYKGPKGEVVDLADFVIFPATAKDIGIEYSRGYGKRYYMRRGEIKKKISEGIWYEEQGKEFLDKTKSGSTVSNFMKSRDTIEGLNRSSKSDDYEIYEVVYNMAFGSDEGERKLLITYSFDKNLVLSCIEYPYRVDFYALFRIQKKPNRLIGGSIVGDLEDINEEIDVIHNQRVNSRKIAEVPSFKAKKSAQNDFDPNDEDNQWRPGVIFWLDDPESFVQFTVQPVDLNSSMAEESNLIKVASLTMGLDPGIFSGGASLDNPSAGKDKVQTLISSSGLRMDDPLSEMRKGIETVGKICLSHEYQFGPTTIEFSNTSDAGTIIRKSFPKRIMRTGIDLKLYGNTVALSPEIEFQKWAQYYGFFSQDPMISSRLKSRWELLMRCLRATREKGVARILPTMEELAQEELEMKTQVAQQLMAQDQQNTVQNQEEKNKRNTTDLSNVVKQNSLIQKLQAQRAMAAGNGNGNGGANGTTRGSVA